MNPLKRFRYLSAARTLPGAKAQGLVAVEEGGVVIGHLNKTRNGYALRDLRGTLVGETYLVGRETAAAALARVLAGEPE